MDQILLNAAAFKQHLCFIRASDMTPFCQTAPLLPSVTWQQHVMGYWWQPSASTAISPTSDSDSVGQDNKIGVTFKAALIKIHT